MQINISTIFKLIMMLLISEKLVLRNYYNCYFSYYFFTILYVLVFFLCLVFEKLGPNHHNNCMKPFLLVLFIILIILLVTVGFFVYIYQFFTNSLCFNYIDIVIFPIIFYSLGFILILLCFCFFFKKTREARIRRGRNPNTTNHSSFVEFEKYLFEIYNKKEKVEIQEFILINSNYINKIRPIFDMEKELVKKYFSKEVDQESYSCIICLVDLKLNTPVINLDENTRNLYHLDCINSWFEKQFCCPVQRKSVCLILLEKIMKIV